MTTTLPVTRDTAGDIDDMYCPICPWPPRETDDMHPGIRDAWLHRHRFERPRLILEWGVSTSITHDGDPLVKVEDGWLDAGDVLRAAAYVWSWQVACDRGGHVLLDSGDVRDDAETPAPPTVYEVHGWLTARGFAEVSA